MQITTKLYSMVFAAVTTLHGVALGAVITNANDIAVNMEIDAAWVGGTAPGSSDIAVFDSVNTSTKFMAGTSLSWYGMVWSRPGNLGQSGVGMTGATGNETLTIGAGGMVFMPVSSGFVRGYIDMPVVVNAAQTWTVTRGINFSPHFMKNITVNADLAVSLSGSGVLVVHEPITVANGARITSAGSIPAMIIADNSHISGTLDITGGSVCIATTNATDVQFSSILTDFENNGFLYLGGSESYTSGNALGIIFGPGDDLTSSATGSNRGDSSLRIYDSNVTVDGGNIRTRWFRLHNGRWTNIDGDTHFDYGNVIGCGTIADGRAVWEQTFDMQGGTYTFRRLTVGLANRDDYPARLIISGGLVQDDVLDPNPSVAKQDRLYSGLDIAVSKISQETPANNNSAFGSEYAAGDVLVSGTGKLLVPRIAFGGNSLQSPVGATSACASGRLRMTGGEIELGTTGFHLGDYWDSNADSWYSVIFSGGKVSTRHVSDTYNNIRQDVLARLSDADGGVTYDIAPGQTYSVGEPMFGTGGFVKTGAGTMILERGNDYTGRTVVSNGSLLVRSTAAASGTAYTAAGGGYTPATMKLVADDLSGADGTSVVSWLAVSGSSPRSEFSVSTASNVLTAAKGIRPTAPVITTFGFNGHKAVSFDGVSSALVSGGAGAAWISSGNSSTIGFSVAMVVRFDGSGEGSAQDDWISSKPFFGTTRINGANAYVWNMALTGVGRLQGGSVWAKNGSDKKSEWKSATTARPIPRWLDDGRPHVVVMTFPSQNEGKVTLTVDGYRSEETANWTGTSSENAYYKTYMTLGGSDMFAVNRYTACTVAEIRFWRGKQLSEAEIKAFSEDMATTYGVELDGYTTFGVSGQHSKEVFVSSGATYGTDSEGFTLPLYAGQTLAGAGSVVGNMSAQSGSTIVLSSSGSPSFENLTLEDGATIRIADDRAKALSAATLASNPSDVVTVDISGLEPPTRSISLASFVAGTVSANNFRILPSNARLSLSIGNGKAKLLFARGIAISFH